MDVLRNLETDHLNARLYKEELNKHAVPVPLYNAPDVSTTIAVGVLSLLIGFFVGIVSR